MVRRVILYPEILHQRLDGEIQRARDDDLPQAEAARFLDQLERARKHCGLEHILKKLVGKKAQPVFRFSLVTLEKKIVKDFSAILIRDGEERQAQERRSALLKTAKQPRLVLRVKTERMNKISAN